VALAGRRIATTDALTADHGGRGSATQARHNCDVAYTAIANNSFRVGHYTGSREPRDTLDKQNDARGRPVALRGADRPRPRTQSRIERLVYRPTYRRLDLNNEALIGENVIRWRFRCCPRRRYALWPEIRQRKFEA
jgi:hypothetical protein